MTRLWLSVSKQYALRARMLLTATDYGAQLPTMPFNYTYAYDPSKKYDDNGYELTYVYVYTPVKAPAN